MAYRPSAGRNQRPVSEPKIPDITPIMNLFLTIIPFLLLMLVITQVALVAFNFSAAPPGASASLDGTGGSQKDIPDITVIIMASTDPQNTISPGFEIREPSQTSKVDMVAGRFDYVSLNANLKRIRENYPDLKDISVAPYDDVEYNDLIKTIDICRNNNFSGVHYKAPQVRYYVGGSS
ncbi:MAG: biopolymer transporter ExbD [Candidatus Cloacimonadaceae bacterium]|jgi:hypothetical protein|nr:biopolymer transporter ExbD [Candidatus Cloacimonadota bacterium]MDX9950098.1 biopolymer transporter ExbD [Candidatus Syntrophosphaera sp.]NLN85102.1 hypothetical protein [Candidatus Cloacimonadota bacterium]